MIQVASAIDNGERRIICPGGHGLGKSHMIAGLTCAFLHQWPNSRVRIIASEDQIDDVFSNIRFVVKNATHPLLPGLKPKAAEWDVSDNWDASGVATNSPSRIRGRHRADMLVFIDEAEGFPDWGYTEVDNWCIADHNIIVAMLNPIVLAGWSYRACTDSGDQKEKWRVITFSALNHPNVTMGRTVIPGAISRRTFEQEVKVHCLPIDDPADVLATDFEYPGQSGKWHRPDSYFQSRLLGLYPLEAEQNVFSYASISGALYNEIPIDETAPVDIGMDVAFQGGDYCVIWARRGPSVIKRRKWRGLNPDQALSELALTVTEYNNEGLRVGTIAIDAIGIGSGIAYGMMRMVQDGVLQADRVLAVQVSEHALDTKTYCNKRAEYIYGLARRFSEGGVDLTRVKKEAGDFESQALQIKRDFEKGSCRFKIPDKNQIRKETKVSPDDLDAMYLCFIDTADTFAEEYSSLVSFG